MTMHWIQGFETGAGGTNNYTFSSIPQNFTHLQLRISGRSTNTGGSFASIYTGFNNDVFVANNYSNHVVYGEGAGVSTTSQASQGQLNVGLSQFIWNSVLSNVQASLIIDILDYTNTSKNKVIKYIMGWDANGSGRVMIGSGMWMNTAAINSIYLSPDSGWAQYTRIDLYGITNNPVATGA